MIHLHVCAYNERHPHSAQGYLSPREYMRHRTSNGLSDKSYQDNIGANPLRFSSKTLK